MRRRFVVGGALACALVFTLAASAAAPAANFAGTWVLDVSKSKDLPPQWADNLESYTLVVMQDDKTLNVEYKMNRKGGAQPTQGGGGQGGPGGGPGGRMMMPPNLSFTYQLDGKETTQESSGDRGGSLSTYKAEWKDDGKALELTTTRKFTTRDGEERTAKTQEHWELSADGKILTIHRSSESPRGSLKTTMVFNKQ